MFAKPVRRQPDILEVISDLSNDEVFTPPRITNAMLDLLPDEVWSDPDLRWFDPVCKTGVFPREITKRLMAGLAEQIPDEDDRLEHILTKMVFGAAITELTAMISRRSLYCSKDAASDAAVLKMPTSEGHLWFRRTAHTYDDRGKCTECSASESQMEASGRDNYAYAFIHANGRSALAEDFDMNFDVIVGNPPYQMDSDGNTRTMPLYHHFVEQAISMAPRFVLMITPSRWFAGGLGLDSFRSSMLADSRISHLVDYPDASDSFPGVKIRGGVSYFLWNRDYQGDCKVQTVRGAEVSEVMERSLDDYDVFVRYNEAVRILDKVRAVGDSIMDEQVSSLVPFGIRAKFRDYVVDNAEDAVELHVRSREVKWVDRDAIENNKEWIDKHKTLLHAAYGEDHDGPYSVIARPFVAGPGSACTETYLVVGVYDSESEAKNLDLYLRTRFVRFLIWLRMNTQHLSKDRFGFVPRLPMDRQWTDELLYERYGIDEDERAYIKRMIREMES